MDDSSSILTKCCNKCGTEHPATTEFFSKRKGHKYGVNNSCKKCVSEYERQRCQAKEKVVSDFKTCPACGIEKPATPEYFPRRWRAKDGLQSECKECKSKVDHAHYLANSEELKAYQRTYKAGHLEKIQERERKYYQTHKEKHLLNYRQYHKAHPEIARTANRNRKARKKAAPGKHTAQDIRDQYERQHGKCYYCKCKVEWNKRHVDHVVPLSRGGSNDPSNLVIACAPCNLSKGDKLLHEWRQSGMLL